MYDFEKFRTSAFRNKYEIAFEKGKTRLTYFELYEKVNALFNALSNMGADGTAMVMTDDLQELVTCALALSKCGMKRVICDSKLPAATAKALANEHTPSVVFIKNSELSRLAPALIESGVKTAIVYGRGESVFPAAFEYSELICRNDYTLIKDYTASAQTEFESAARGKLPELDFSAGFVIDLPCFCMPCAELVSEILYSGGKCMILEDISAKACKRKKVMSIITDKSRLSLYGGSGCDVIDIGLDTQRVGGSLLDCKKISEALSRISGASVSVCYNGAVINVTATFPSDFDETSQAAQIQALKSAARDMLCPFDKKKTIAIKKSR